MALKNLVHRGSQIRQKIEDSEYRLIACDHREAILEDTTDGNLELYAKQDDHAGFVIEIKGQGYEFVRTLTA